MVRQGVAIPHPSNILAPLRSNQPIADLRSDYLKEESRLYKARNNPCSFLSSTYDRHKDKRQRLLL